jgi:hypothetical protein
VARNALATLQAQLVNRTFVGCSQRSRVRTCTFVDAGGRTTKVLWRTSGSSKVRVPRAGEIVEMTGATRAVGAGQKVPVGTTPIVLR